MRETGVTKHELKIRGIREAGAPNLYTRNILFTGNTLRSYEGVPKFFVEHAQREYGVQRLEDAGKKALRSFMDRAIEQGLAVKTLHRYRSALTSRGKRRRASERFASRLPPGLRRSQFSGGRTESLGTRWLNRSGA